ncbi:hypothetical protein ThidrDRAFT_4054 [Thiorhodococcus drewsii AZ1]|uniref:Uncharacterized protein n=1 Tax=Thiorhodococcus drewsii AZ1 TaxID=765913 RepID=G2E6Z1_9GAMM|nr:hypothetical protein ThidrDRAFT_4054 [Thiorhodococcus drewsii AZ1]
MFSIRHWKWWHWLLAGILMPLLMGALGLLIYIGLAAIELVARMFCGPAQSRGRALDSPRMRLVATDPETLWNDGDQLVGSMFDDTERRDL